MNEAVVGLPVSACHILTALIWKSLGERNPQGGRVLTPGLLETTVVIVAVALLRVDTAHIAIRDKIILHLLRPPNPQNKYSLQLMIQSLLLSQYGLHLMTQSLLLSLQAAGNK